LKNFSRSVRNRASSRRASAALSHLDSGSDSDSSDGGKFDVEELEMLLESYFLQIDNSLNKLSTVGCLPLFVSSRLSAQPNVI
jgi:hypothetical protein